MRRGFFMAAPGQARSKAANQHEDAMVWCQGTAWQVMNSDFDHYSESYIKILAESTGAEPESASFYARQKVYHLARNVYADPPIQTILDYGCGVGLSIRPLRQRFPQVQLFGADPSSLSLEVAAREHADCDPQLLALEQLSEPKYSGSFDIIFVSCVFHHIDADNHIETLRRLRHLCSPSGQIIIFEHNPINPITRRIVRNCPFDEGVILISPRTLGDRLKAAGWQRLKTRYVSFVPPRLEPIAVAEPLLGWCPLGAQYFIRAQAN